MPKGKPKRLRTTIPADIQARRGVAANLLATAMPHNRNKASEYAGDWAAPPPTGPILESDDEAVFASTLSETIQSLKVGDGATPAGSSPLNDSLDRMRVDATAQPLTTNQGVAVADNQSSLKAGVRGPTLLEDFVLREKITHFDHERIPERVVHARGSGAHGYFECYGSLKKHTRASVFAERGKRSPVFVRFSTVLGERGSADTVRDVRGFAVKFYTDEGNWDLVGNNMPIFFIQDAMKFPDLVHAAKPEPHNAVPQAGSAHDTFWDFASLMPETTAMLLWVMSDRGIPRSYRTMQGFGVHTFRFIDADGGSSFVKFHWTPAAGTHSLVWDEAVKIAGADPDFHRRDLWEAIESANYPEYELGVQIFSEADADRYSFDVLDATKLVPEELVPVIPIGKMVLNRNPDNFFAETEQVAFCTAHLVPGIDFSNDPLLAGRIHSYVDTQISRLGGANFHEIPINAALSPVHNNQRDGMHRQAIPRGRVAYEPNSLGGGCPFQAGGAGFTSFPEQRMADEHKMRGKPERFAEHYAQATLFWSSQTPAEQRHIVGGFRFELSKVSVPAIRERMVASLRNVAADLASAVANGLGIDDLPQPMPRAMEKLPKVEVKSSSALSLLARPGDGNIRGRRVALLIHDGIDVGQIEAIRAALAAEGAIPQLLGRRLGVVRGAQGKVLVAEATLENSPAVLFDGCVLPDGGRGVELLAREPACVAFVQDQYRHCKPILALGAAALLLDQAGIPPELPSGAADPALILGPGPNALAEFIEWLGKHRDFSREPATPV